MSVSARTVSYPQQRWKGDKDCSQNECRGNESCKESLREKERVGEDLYKESQASGSECLKYIDK